MSDYRLYCVDGGGNIGFADWIQASTDEEAISKAREMLADAQKCEVWLGNQLVAKINSSGRLELVAT